MKNPLSLKRKRTKQQQAEIASARSKMKEQTVESKKTYSRKTKHKNAEEESKRGGTKEEADR